MQRGSTAPIFRSLLLQILLIIGIIVGVVILILVRAVVYLAVTVCVISLSYKRHPLRARESNAHMAI